jgi:methyl-accepting chemotaxis protein
MHEDLHPMIRNFAEEFGYQDVYLVDSESGDVAYSMMKRIDFGTSLIDGPFAESHLGELFSLANTAVTPGEFFIADFEPYEPSFEKPTAFMATPIFEENRKLGVLIFEFPVDKFKNVMSDRSGLGQTGETYLVGGDQLFRSDSYLNPTNFSMEVSFQDFEEVETAQVLAGLSGDSGVGVSRNYMDNHVLSAWRPFEFEGFNWVLVSEMRVGEVLNPLNASGSEFYRDFSELSDYNDLFLILPNGVIFYTAAREADYRTNILNGNFKNSNLAKLVRKIGYGALDIQQMNKQVRFTDFVPYEPKGNVPAAFLAKGVKISNSLLGTTNQTSRTNLGSQLVVALQLSDSTLNEVMLQRTGLGETGESYLVGPDLKPRTSTRDPNRNLASSLSGEVSLNGADTEPVRLALAGQSDTGLYQNYNGDWVLASFSPINAHDQTWALITEIQASEVLRPVWILALVVLVLLLGVVALVVQLALFFSRNITEPVTQTALALQTIAEEQDLTVQVDVEQEDEIGQMAEAMRQMVSQLNSALQHVEWSSRQVQQESSVLESTGRQLAEQSSTQAASLEEISSSMVELNAQTKHNHELSTRVSTESQQMSRQAQTSSEQMQRFSKMMAEIESSTENVTQITSLISEIAAQTRMLAINASIEAARAGAHGAGFAVVAQEVQELAAQTAESAEEIARVVGASVEKVQSGRKTLGEAQGSLEEIFGTTESVAEMMQMIRHAAEEQSQGIRQVNQALEELNQMTMENAQFSEVNAKSSSQLSQQAEELLEVVHQFRLWEGEEEEERESPAALPEPEELEAMETAPAN